MWNMPDPAATWFVLFVTWITMAARWAYKAGLRRGRDEKE